jgi:hypothetical protein
MADDDDDNGDIMYISWDIIRWSSAGNSDITGLNRVSGMGTSSLALSCDGKNRWYGPIYMQEIPVIIVQNIGH